MIPIPDTSQPAAENTSGAPATVIEPHKGWRALDFRELWQYRELLYFLVWRDIKVRYKQTVLGASWAIIQPLMTMVVFSIFFGRFGGMAAGSTVPYEILVFSALVPWTFFANSSSGGGNSLVNSAHLISKVYFPRLLIPLSSLGAPLLDMLIAFVVLILMLVGYLVAGAEGIEISWQLALLPVFLLMTVVTAFGVGTFMSSLTIAYRDFRYVMAFLIQLWMFATPVAYGLVGEARPEPEHKTVVEADGETEARDETAAEAETENGAAARIGVPKRWWRLYALNPMTGAIVGFRRCVTGQPIPWDVVGISAMSGVVCLIAGVFYFRRIEKTFADLI